MDSAGAKRTVYDKRKPEDQAAMQVRRLSRPPLECDMVMKGGITSGVVYPLAVSELASRYRLRNVGGTSAGAIAAAAAAAAELGRKNGGFDQLEALPAFLGENLQDLMQPSRKTKAVFMTLLQMVGHGSKWGKALRASMVAARHYPAVFVATFVLLCAPAIVLLGNAPGPGFAVASYVGLVLSAVIALAVSLGFLFWRARIHLLENGFGACTGHNPDYPDSNPNPPLTDWMDETFSDLAFGERNEGDAKHRSVTFADLWGEPATEQYRALPTKLHDQVPTEIMGLRDINLEVMTTSLSMRRPFRVPFAGVEWLWCVSCFKRYFPKSVIDQMVNTSSGARAGEGALVSDPFEPDSDADPQATLANPDDPGGTRRVVPISSNCPTCGHKDSVRMYPAAPDVPVVVAVRMSLSFPGLFSAVPLLTVDRSRDQQKQALETIWLSDGGLSSNFPIHFFDALLPGRPTFGIDLLPKHPDFDDMVYLPQRIAGAPFKRVHPIDSFGGFVNALKDTMQNWNDVAQGTLPGYRDRVVQVRMRPAEGGLNLKMKADAVTELADRGERAAKVLIHDFRFERHRETRFRVAVPELDDALAGVSAKWGEPADDDGQIKTYRAFMPYRADKREDFRKQLGGALTEGKRQTASKSAPADGVESDDSVAGETMYEHEVLSDAERALLAWQQLQVQEWFTTHQKLQDDERRVPTSNEALQPRPTLRLTPRT